LVGTDPFSLDGPCAEALVVQIVAREVAMLDQAASGMAAVEVDDFVLAHFEDVVASAVMMFWSVDAG